MNYPLPTQPEPIECLQITLFPENTALPNDSLQVISEFIIWVNN